MYWLNNSWADDAGEETNGDDEEDLEEEEEVAKVLIFLKIQFANNVLG